MGDLSFLETVLDGIGGMGWITRCNESYVRMLDSIDS